MSAIWCQRVIPSLSAAFLMVSAGLALADREQGGIFYARLTGFQEAPSSISSPGRGEFKGRIDPRTGVIDYEFSYEGMANTITQAHIHFGQRATTGGITVWLCGTQSNPGPSGTPACTQGSGFFTGVIDESKILAVSAQKLEAGNLAELLQAMRAGATYANVHTAAPEGVPSGEIRGQIRHRAEK